jgi:anthranilate/para-aminobenzoate synthase component II
MWLIDFEDSFTYNVAAELALVGLACEVIPWREALEAETAPALVVLGPGPGHPDDYAFLPALTRWWRQGSALGGICLGHQLLARHLNLSVTRSRCPLHGQTERLKVDPAWSTLVGPEEALVQRYNSLAVPLAPLPAGWKGWAHRGELIGLWHQRALSYQFHPESVGTSCPRRFFEPFARL